MKHKIFFSWQSDLPNNGNRNFIESTLNKAIKEIKKENTYLLGLNIDRDTLNVSGSPDISESIFDKINKCTFFVADISIINKTSQGRKTPNPNVLIELGYAVNKLGWDRIICVFNKDFGDVTELPFDLRNRRVYVYETLENKENEKKKMVSTFKKIFEDNYESMIFSNELMDYYNGDIYLSLFTLVMDISKIITGYEEHKSNTQAMQTILNYSYEDIRTLLSQKIVLGFQIFKSYENYTKELCSLLEKIVPIKNFTDDYYVPIVRLINNLRLFNKALNRQNHWDELEIIKCVKTNYFLEGKINSNGENRLVLLKKISNNKGVVIDYGDFQRKDHIDNLLNEFKVKEYTLNFYSGFFYNLIKDINWWIDNNGGEFIIDQTQLEGY